MQAEQKQSQCECKQRVFRENIIKSEREINKSHPQTDTLTL